MMVVCKISDGWTDGRMDNQTPKFSAQKCPVCNGFGTLRYGQRVCQACKGKGFVVINNETGLPVLEGEENGRVD